MEFVVDTNILISSVVKDSGTRKLLNNPALDLYAPELILFEFWKHKTEIMKKSGLDEGDFRKLFAVLFSRISLIPEDEFKQHLEEALKISPDPEDAPFFALCISKNIPLWSNEKKLKRQSKVKVFSTEELLKLI